MPRKARFAPPGYWLHILQRGHDHRPVFRHDDDRDLYLDLLGRYAQERQIQVLGYNLMPDHLHLVALGKYPQAVSDWMRCLNGHYAQRMLALEASRGRFWQDRFFSCTVEDRHLRSVLRYVEQNPVRSGLAPEATEYLWSSAGGHTGRVTAPWFLNQQEFAMRFTRSDWRLALAHPQSSAEIAAIRHATRLGLPLGSPEFLSRLEVEFDIRLSRLSAPPKAMAAGAA